ncbi:MAG: hypothetical protein ACR2JB_03725 [Bryobacteraceae bacterium]
MKIQIESQDKRQPEMIKFELHPDLITRLKDYSQSLDSDANYIVAQILDQVLPNGKKERAPRAKRSNPKGGIECDGNGKRS